jgi:hypothetical protein
MAALDRPEDALAGKSTLNRLEHAGKIGRDRHHKLDHDATEDPLHGEQEGRHFHGYYDCYCYLPLYIFCGRHLLCAKLRSSAKDAADGAREEVARIVAQLRERWPNASIVIRADSGFCRDDLMTCCEENGVKYVLGARRRSAPRQAHRAPIAESQIDVEAHGQARACSPTSRIARARAGGGSAA